MPDAHVAVTPSVRVPRPVRLLTTKLYIPRSRPRDRVVIRSRLMERLEEAIRMGCKLTLVSAPAGYGKTTLLSEWIAHSKSPVAWVSLDEGDNDPARFWSYSIAALHGLDTHIGDRALSLLQSWQSASLESVLTTLVNEVDAFPDSLTLVLDDYHFIEAQSIHSSVAFFLDHLPPRMHLIIAGRTDPPLPLAHLRARNELMELRAHDLRFAPDETSIFLNQVMDLSLSPEHVKALEVRTEGWIAGLQLAALSMSGHDDLPGFIAAFTGSHRFILDYLSDQVLEQQSKELQLFLLQTSILDRMNASLCDAVVDPAPTAQNDGSAAKQGVSQAILEKLEQRNLFLVPLDDERCWYRYHHLFLDVLRHRLQETLPDRMTELHRRASEWFECEGMLPDAVNHALAAHDLERAAQLIERGVSPLWRRSEITALATWMQALTDTIWRTRPGLCLAYARALIDTAQYATAETFVQQAEAALESGLVTDDARVASLRGQAAALRAHLAVTRSEFVQAIELARRAQELLAEDDASWCSFVALGLAGAYRLTDDWEAACQTYLEASELSHAAGDDVSALIALSSRGDALQAQGQLRQAARQYEEVLQFAQTWRIPNAPATGYALAGLGHVWCEWNDLEAATRYAQDGLERGKQADLADVFLQGHLVLVRAYLARGDLESALAELAVLEPVVRRMGVQVQDRVSALRVHVRLVQGNTEAAARWAEGITGDSQDALHPGALTTLARVWLAQGQSDKALRLLDHALHTAQQAGRLGSTIQILILEALAHWAQGDSEQALAALEKALSLAEPQGYVRIFVDESAPMARLLRRAAIRAPSSMYIRQLLEALGAPPDTEAPPSTALIEPLTERELQVLRLMADGATNQEIAHELVLAVNTVKKHTSNIFGKLGVSNRAQCIARARELSFL
jgi:LuxR family maltose regulon positive regulatory protein